MKVRAFDKKKKVWIEPEEIARLCFNEGECYGLMTWDDKLLMSEDFTLEIVQPPQRKTVPSSPRQVETLARQLPEVLEEIKTLTERNIPYYGYGDNEAACELANRLAEIYKICEGQSA